MLDDNGSGTLRSVISAAQATANLPGNVEIVSLPGLTGTIDLAGSAAIGAGGSFTGPTGPIITDQRGLPRPTNSGDIGAYQTQVSARSTV
jgi:hypothetical protein